MSWTGIIDKLLGLWQTLINPSDYKQRKVLELERKHDALKKKRDNELGKKKPNPVILGAVTRELLRVRREIAKYNK